MKWQSPKFLTENPVENNRHERTRAQNHLTNSTIHREMNSLPELQILIYGTDWSLTCCHGTSYAIKWLIVRSIHRRNNYRVKQFRNLPISNMRRLTDLSSLLFFSIRAPSKLENVTESINSFSFVSLKTQNSLLTTFFLFLFFVSFI